MSFFLANFMLLTMMSGVYLAGLKSTIFIEWILGGSFVNLSVTLLLDSMSCFFLAVVLCISANVVWYSKSYMSNDPDANRFILLVLGFVASMVVLIVSPNIFSILLGWDGLGLISYCLVIYYPSKKSSSAGMITVLSNRVGDVCILLSIAWFMMVADFNLNIWTLSSDMFSNCSLISFLVMFAAMTKSAQIPFSAWLPAAMAAPTPVSALVHSSTLVTAGVYLLIRFSYLMGYGCSMSLLFISTMTMFMSGVVAIFEYDLKKVIALSTLSQLGMMMFSISLGLYEVAFFHLLSHALFKALLFLCAGILIHGVGNTQDARAFGGLVLSFPLVAVCMNLANFSLCGIPFMAGFYSKDLIVEMACQSSWGVFILFMMFICLGLTVLYSVRLAYLSFVNFKGGSGLVSVCEADYTLSGPVVILSLISLISGPSLSWLSFSFPSLIFLPVFLKWGAIFVITVSLMLMFILTRLSLIYSLKSSLLSKSSGLMWFLPWISGTGVTLVGLSKTDTVLKIMDQGWLEYYSNIVTSVYPASLNSFNLKFQHNAVKLHFMIFMVWLLLGFIYVI
uniref:NADH-ubiquinone oxidoreductase chain 5 n=1 Tax=Daphnia laevis TaxID=42853 RepID=A0A5Q0RZU1_9CRUS|nr:NADH dehydrogenase subunit 5 [Daphnia laevis]QGA47449.1 NADH dehydrogenase subunit 5 [Daphnia laevis]